jgi:hypothetical protein
MLFVEDQSKCLSYTPKDFSQHQEDQYWRPLFRLAILQNQASVSGIRPST